MKIPVAAMSVAIAFSSFFGLTLFARAPLHIHPPRDAEFFIIASIDEGKRELVLKAPTEVTELVKATNHTSYLDANGKKLRFADLRAGDAVYIIKSRDVDGVPRVLSLHRGSPADEKPLDHAGH
jgi:hypothetical protein